MPPPNEGVPNLALTAKAENFIRRMIRFGGGGAGAGLRLTVTPGGCSGFSADFTVETEPFPGDAVIDSGGVLVFLPVETRLLLDGFTVDFTDSPSETGLKFYNANASTRPASCATSTSSNAGSVTATVSVASVKR